ncbi:MAG: sodium:proton antiporter [Clostridia bacterium]|nr:sodium:proton antiporter [Clostridia bacterium]MBR5545033.1 sodium:proton antiporter [Clostridia bacterium]
MLEQAYSYLYLAVFVGLGIAIIAALIRSITAKTIIGRFIGVNILTTIILIVICILTLFLNEGYLPDIALIYALLSCIAVVLLSKIYINLFKKDNGGEK